MSVSNVIDRAFDDLLTSPERPLPGGEPSLPRIVTYFRCLRCRFEFSLADSSFLTEPYTAACLNCEGPVSVRMVHAQDGMEVLELEGCEYGHTASVLESSGTAVAASTDEILHWIRSDTAPPAPQESPPDAFGEKKTFVDEFTSKWVIRKGWGRRREFETFAAVRRAIEEGEIRAKDRISAPDGRVFRVDRYPGTADLFGHGELAHAARTGERRGRTRAHPLREIGRKTIRFASMVLAAALIAAVGYVAPRYLTGLQRARGEALVRELTAAVGPADRGADYAKTLAEATESFLSREPERLPKAVSGFLRAVAIRPESPEAISRLAEALTEVGNLTSDRTDLRRAKELAGYARLIDPRSADAARASVRLAWRTEGAAGALSLLESQSEAFFDSAEGNLLAARIAAEAGRSDRAAIWFNAAISKEPGRAGTLAAFADFYEAEGKYAQAAVYLERAQSVGANPGAYTERLALLHEKAKDLESAGRVYRDAIRRGENEEKNKYLLIAMLSKHDRPNDVVRESLSYFANFRDGTHHPEVVSLYRKALALIEPSSRDSNRPSVRRRALSLSTR